MEKSPIDYKILYHEKGYIRLEVPFIRKLSWSFLFMNVKKAVSFPVPAGIKDFHINPLKGSIVITYEPGGIDIIKYIKAMTRDPEVRRIMGGRLI
jgi:hypothetical protein